LSCRDIVRNLLALDTDAVREPPDHGVVEQDGFDQALRQVDQVIAAAHVRQFMRQQGLQQLRRHA
jgi:hypothetical protein